MHIGRRLAAPAVFALNSTKHIVKGAASMAGSMVRGGIKGVRKIGKSVAKSANTMVRNVTRRRN